MAHKTHWMAAAFILRSETSFWSSRELTPQSDTLHNVGSKLSRPPPGTQCDEANTLTLHTQKLEYVWSTCRRVSPHSDLQRLAKVMFQGESKWGVWLLWIAEVSLAFGDTDSMLVCPDPADSISAQTHATSATAHR